MNLLCTHPGRHGDIAWALPSIRALHEAGHTVTLALSPKYSSLKRLIEQQEYVARVIILDGWEVREDAPISPRVPSLSHTSLPRYDAVVHLGYDGWPLAPLPYHVYSTLKREHPDLPIAPLDLERPWIRVSPLPDEQFGEYGFSVGFSDEWFELKVGLLHLLNAADPMWWVTPIFPIKSRWELEVGGQYPTTGCTWIRSAQIITRHQLFLGCCSALHVLACALGRPCIIAEPAEARHNPVFWPYGKDGPRVLAPKGIDGRQTWDARAIRSAIDHFFQTERLA